MFKRSSWFYAGVAGLAGTAIAYGLWSKVYSKPTLPAAPYWENLDPLQQTLHNPNLVFNSDLLISSCALAPQNGEVYRTLLQIQCKIAMSAILRIKFDHSDVTNSHFIDVENFLTNNGKIVLSTPINNNDKVQVLTNLMICRSVLKTCNKDTLQKIGKFIDVVLDDLMGPGTLESKKPIDNYFGAKHFEAFLNKQENDQVVQSTLKSNFNRLEQLVELLPPNIPATAYSYLKKAMTTSSMQRNAPSIFSTANQITKEKLDREEKFEKLCQVCKLYTINAPVESFLTKKLKLLKRKGCRLYRAIFG